MKFFLIILLFLAYISTVRADSAADNRLTLDFKDIPVRDILQILANIHHTNIVISDKVQGNISVHLAHVSWQQAFNVILKEQNLGVQKTDSILMVSPLTDIAEQQEMQENLDNLALLHACIIPLHYTKAETVANLIKNQNKSLLSSRGNISADARTNKLWVEDVPSKLEQIQQFVGEIDVPVKQVLIEARIVTIDEKYEQELGIRFGLTRPNNHLSGKLEGANNLLKNNTQDGVNNPLSRLNVDLPTQNPNAATIGLALAALGRGNLLDLELSALETEGAGRIISSPRLMTADQQPATILSGQEIPYQQSANYGATSVSFQKAVLSLTVTPQITPDGKLLLTLQVNQDRPGATLIPGVPEIETREIKTQVMVNDGQTLVLGGIYEQDQRNQLEQVPVLGNLPFIGHLFRHTQQQKNRRELLVFVTPTIIRSN
jgi:type IV pilus assembly protein PilQ